MAIGDGRWRRLSLNVEDVAQMCAGRVLQVSVRFFISLHVDFMGCHTFVAPVAFFFLVEYDRRHERWRLVHFLDERVVRMLLASLFN